MGTGQLSKQHGPFSVSEHLKINDLSLSVLSACRVLTDTAVEPQQHKLLGQSVHRTREKESPNMAADRNRFTILAAFGAIYFRWGKTYIAIALGIQSIPPFLLMGSRSVIGGALFDEKPHS